MTETFNYDDEGPFRGSTEAMLAAYYGEGVSGILRGGDYPVEPSSFIVQQQQATAGGVSRWYAKGVYVSRAAAEAFVARMEEMPTTLSTVDPGTGESEVAEEQPLTAYRVVTLLDLFAEGSEALGAMLYDLATSDHEWVLSCELGVPAIHRLLLAADG